MPRRNRSPGTASRSPAASVTSATCPTPSCVLVRVVRSAHGIDEEEALREVAREFGVTRVAAKVRERLAGVIGSAVAEGTVIREGSQLTTAAR